MTRTRFNITLPLQYQTYTSMTCTRFNITLPLQYQTYTSMTRTHFNITLQLQYQTYTSMTRTHFNITLQLHNTLQFPTCLWWYSPTDITKNARLVLISIRTTYTAHLTSCYNPTEAGSKILPEKALFFSKVPRRPPLVLPIAVTNIKMATQHWWNDNDRGKPRPSATLSTKNPTCIGRGSNLKKMTIARGTQMHHRVSKMWHVCM